MSAGTPIVVTPEPNRQFKPLRSISLAKGDGAAVDEEFLQEVIDQTPEILPIRDFFPSAQSVISLGREIPLDLGERQGFVDNMLVTNEGRLVLVETKLWRNPEAIREVVIQTLEYGMTVSRLGLQELEARLRRSDPKGTHLSDRETIHDFVTSRPENQRAKGVDASFGEALENHLASGEVLLLIVADGIRTSVERIAQWMNDKAGSSPLRFGLVELQLYEMPDGSRLVTPKTRLRTREISRHVVVVDIRNDSSARASATVTDEFRTKAGTAASETRPVRSAGPPITKEALLAQITEADRPTVEALIEGLESIGLDQNTKGTHMVRYGLTYPADGGEFIPLFYFTPKNAWGSCPKRIRELLGEEGAIEFKKAMNRAADFWNSDQLSNPDSGGSGIRYALVKSRTGEIVTALEEFKARLVQALEAEQR